MSLRAYASGVWREAIPDFSWRRTADLRQEALIGVFGAVLVIPQAITFAFLAGLPPQYGLYCAVFVALASSLFGSSPILGGPNTAVSILLCLAILPFAGRGSPLYTDYILLLSLMVGLIQLLIWLLRGAEFFRYFSPAAISGIKIGVGILLVTSSLEGAFGLSPLSTSFLYEKYYVVFASWGELVNPYSATISAVTLLGGLLLHRRWPRTYIIIAMGLGYAVGAVIDGVVGPVASEVEMLGRVSFQALPLTLPKFSLEYLLVMAEVLPQAVAIAVIGLAQSLVIARDLRTHGAGRIDLSREVFAQGMANALGPFFSAFAGSGSFNRTSVAMDMGAKTPLSGIVSAIAVAVLAWSLGPLLTRLPMPVVAGVLALVVFGMIQDRDAGRQLKNRIDGTVMLITVLTVAFLGLGAGILVAALASVGFFIASVSRVDLVIVREETFERVTVSGNLFFASLDALTGHLRESPATHTVLDLRRVPYCDTAALSMIESIRQERLDRGGRLDVEMR